LSFDDSRSMKRSGNNFTRASHLTSFSMLRHRFSSHLFAPASSQRNNNKSSLDPQNSACCGLPRLTPSLAFQCLAMSRLLQPGRRTGQSLYSRRGTAVTTATRCFSIIRLSTKAVRMRRAHALLGSRDLRSHEPEVLRLSDQLT
jgi:hypothetical protein